LDTGSGKSKYFQVPYIVSRTVALVIVVQEIFCIKIAHVVIGG